MATIGTYIDKHLVNIDSILEIKQFNIIYISLNSININWCFYISKCKIKNKIITNFNCFTGSIKE